MKKIFFLLVLLFSFGTVSAQTIKELVFFGDSLTDNGNLYSATYKILPKSPPYYMGHFSNGPVWAEIFGDYYHNKFGTEYSIYAVGGATTISRRPKDGALPYYLKKEIDSYLSNTEYSQRSKTLFLFWIGGNDYMGTKKQPPNDLVNEVVNEIVSQIKTLITHGGRKFVLIDMPDFSKVPFANSLDEAEKDRLRVVSEINHEKMAEAVALLKNEYPNFTFILIDAFNMFNNILMNTEWYNQKYGLHIINTWDSCWLGGYSLTEKNRDMLKADLQSEAMADYVLHSPDLIAAYQVDKSQTLGLTTPCTNPEEYMFWDTVHPTSATHELLGKLMIEQIERMGS